MARSLPPEFQRQIPFQFSPQGRNQGTERPGTGPRITLRGRKKLFWRSPDPSWIQLPASLTGPKWVPPLEGKHSSHSFNKELMFTQLFSDPLTSSTHRPPTAWLSGHRWLIWQIFCFILCAFQDGEQHFCSLDLSSSKSNHLVGIYKIYHMLSVKQ